MPDIRESAWIAINSDILDRLAKAAVDEKFDVDSETWPKSFYLLYFDDLERGDTRSFGPTSTGWGFVHEELIRRIRNLLDVRS